MQLVQFNSVEQYSQLTQMSPEDNQLFTNTLIDNTNESHLKAIELAACTGMQHSERPQASNHMLRQERPSRTTSIAAAIFRSSSSRISAIFAKPGTSTLRSASSSSALGCMCTPACACAQAHMRTHISTAHIVMACTVMTCTVTAEVVMVFISMVHMVMAHIAMAYTRMRARIHICTCVCTCRLVHLLPKVLVIDENLYGSGYRLLGDNGVFPAIACIEPIDGYFGNGGSRICAQLVLCSPVGRIVPVYSQVPIPTDAQLDLHGYKPLLTTWVAVKKQQEDIHLRSVHNMMQPNCSDMAASTYDCAGAKARRNEVLSSRLAKYEPLTLTGSFCQSCLDPYHTLYMPTDPLSIPMDPC